MRRFSNILKMVAKFLSNLTSPHRPHLPTSIQARSPLPTRTHHIPLFTHACTGYPAPHHFLFSRMPRSPTLSTSWTPTRPSRPSSCPLDLSRVFMSTVARCVRCGYSPPSFPPYILTSFSADFERDIICPRAALT
jgi:hypothetical protein